MICARGRRRRARYISEHYQAEGLDIINDGLLATVSPAPSTAGCLMLRPRLDERARVLETDVHMPRPAIRC